jgi:hypothetical protein
MSAPFDPWLERSVVGERKDDPAVVIELPTQRDTALATVTSEEQLGLIRVRRLIDFLEERSKLGWPTRSDWRRLRIGLNLRRVSLGHALSYLRPDGEDDSVRPVHEALSHLDEIVATEATSSDEPVDARAEILLAEAITDLLQALLLFLRPSPCKRRAGAGQIPG